LNPLYIPLKNCDKITPELPRAPINIPLDSFLDISYIDFESNCLISFAPASIVIRMFVPVSPSGTGNTFKASTSL
jgi:hypothetical protein